MSTTATTATSVSTTTVTALEEAKTTEKKEVTQSKFKRAMAFTKQHAAILGKAGQIGGAAGLVAGGVAMMFAGIGANLTVAGTPLGVPLLAAGGALFAAGSILLIMETIQKRSGTIGNAISKFFNETVDNALKGAKLGGLVAASAVFLPITTSVPLLIAFIKAKNDPNSQELMKKFGEQLNKAFGEKIPLNLIDGKNLNDVEKMLSEAPKKAVAKLDEKLNGTDDSKANTDATPTAQPNVQERTTESQNNSMEKAAILAALGN